jgi:CRP-like cAMP-binding protein
LAGISRRIAVYRQSEVAFGQGDPANDVFHLQTAHIKVSVLSRTGREAVVAMLGPGDFCGEGCLAGQPRRMSTTSAMSPSAAFDGPSVAVNESIIG